MANRPKLNAVGGITYLHREYDIPIGGRFIWRIPDNFGVGDDTEYGFEVLRERVLRFGTKAYELSELATRLLNAVTAIDASNRDRWIPHETLYDFFRDTRNQTPPLVPSYLARTLDALDTMMVDATERQNTPFIERSIRGTGYKTNLRLNPRIGFEDNRGPRNYDLPFD